MYKPRRLKASASLASRAGSRVAFEVACLRRYLACALAQAVGSRGSRLHRELVEWTAEFGSNLGLRYSDLKIDGEKFDRQGLTPDQSRRFAAAVLSQLRDIGSPPPSGLEARLRWIAKMLGLDRVDTTILAFAVRAALFAPTHALAAAAVGCGKHADEVHLEAIATLLGLPVRNVHDRLRRHRPLLQLGLLEDRGGGDYAASGTVLRLARLARGDPDRIRRELFGKAPRPEFAWRDFDHLGATRDRIAALLEAALERREPGVGILFYGPPGTGKTEFAKTLALKVNARVVFVGEADADNGEPSRSERVSHFALTSALAGQAGRTILVVDEAEDLFIGVDDNGVRRRGSKVFMNRLVERCAAPTIWITNTHGELGPAVLRRMMLAIPFRAPGPEARRGVAERLARRHKVKLVAADLDRLAAVEAPPSFLGAGLRAAALTKGGVAAALQAAESLLAAMGQRTPGPALRAPLAFDPSLSAADCDLVALADRARTSFEAGETALSFCFHGLPGTGKSAYARFIAERLGLEVIEKRASDILSMWVGGTEQNIAGAFAEAAERRAMLVIDEADSLLRDRAGAQRSWEAMQVNEMLTWMERHPYPFVCTTNAMESLDPATPRRFLFKVEFLPMSPAQSREAFRRTFGMEGSAALDYLDPLTPGDFAVASRKARVLGERDATALVALLAAELAAKPRVRPVGFTARLT